MPRRAARDDAATTAIVGFAVVLVIFTTSFAAFLAVFRAPAQQSSDAPFLDTAAADSLVDILDTTGYRSSGAARSKAWEGAPDSITRFGLAKDGDPGLLDVAKLRNATRGGVDAAGNGLLDYEEVRAVLGLQQANFHLRTQPVWSTLAAAGLPAVNLSVAYLGDFTSTPGGLQTNYPALNVSAVEDKGDHVYVNITVTNNGTLPTMFRVDLRVPLEGEDLEDASHTPVLGLGEAWRVSLKLWKSGDWAWASLLDQNVHVQVHDPIKKVGDYPISLLANGMGLVLQDPDQVALTISPEKLTYKTNQFPKVRWTHWEADGDDGNPGDVNITVRNAATGAVLHQWQGDAGSEEWQLPAKLPEGRYNLSVFLVADPGYAGNDTLVVEDDAISEFLSTIPATVTESAASKWERGLLASLVIGFRNTTHEVASGHVYRDFASSTDGPLADNLTAGLFDVLVVGSEVGHDNLDLLGARTAIQGFVEAGGLVLVLGSSAQSDAWLQPLFDASTASTTAPAGFDDSHPVLHAPEALAFRTYLDGGRSWPLAIPGDGGHFTHVAGATGAAALESDLAVSRPGHFGDGGVLLTSWQLFALTPGNDRDEALAALYNFLLFGANALYLDLGPPVPDHAEVAGATRIAAAPHPMAAGERLLVRVSLLVFR